MDVTGKKISAVSARSHTRKMMNSNSTALPQGMLKSLSIVMLVGLLALAYKAIQPTPPSICGSPNGPPVASSRVKLSDGRHLAYKETGVPKEKAKHKIIFIHGFDSCRHDVLQVSQLKNYQSIYCHLTELVMERVTPIQREQRKAQHSMLKNLLIDWSLGQNFTSLDSLWVER